MGLYSEYYEVFSPRELAKQDSFQWRTQGAIDFINVLVKSHEENKNNYPIYCYHINWIKDSEIADLVSLIDSNKPCAQVNFIYSSEMPVGSTVGVEAVRMIMSYWKKYYPVKLDATHIEIIKKDIKDWYRIWVLIRQKTEKQGPVMGLGVKPSENEQTGNQ